MPHARCSDRCQRWWARRCSEGCSAGGSVALPRAARSPARSRRLAEVLRESCAPAIRAKRLPRRSDLYGPRDHWKNYGVWTIEAEQDEELTRLLENGDIS